ncbi:Predicted ATP-binding protein involved in virulence [Filimonas lacunae]|uniref:Predicted ATP-binding protein involved in virulence n=1 Tax=Filimonas lacunae TaxID=477680 RepID=A0A173MHB2_9BACT|nr:AAA family ATPase [Filimonas lacunae]BAV06808.1 ATP binding protein SugR [Filimonas lacunae]SIS99458.1 Predicted ATP-binding protein involved in virulence [Filimonas lacunae]
MNIQRLVIRNFRNIGDDEVLFDLNSRFTVIIGVNGRGKSTILNALRVACGAFFLGIPDVKQKGGIKSEEIRQLEERGLLISVKPVKVEAYGTMAGTSEGIIWRRQIVKGSNSNSSTEADVGQIRQLGQQKYNEVTENRNDAVGLPVIALFGTSRAHGAGRASKTRIGRQLFKDGYQDWSEMKSTSFSYENWLKSYDILKEGGREYAHTKDAFFNALKKGNRYIEEVREVAGKLWLKVKLEDQISEFLPIELHSDGIRFYTEMIAELAYRCIVLNGYLDADAVTGSYGIVMIDELDLHLHPNWQKVVVQDLKNAFPHIQFVVTTHSPFIVQSLESSELINLDPVAGLDEDPQKYSIEEVAEQEMGVKNVERSTQFMEMQQAAATYFELVKGDAEPERIGRAKVLLDQLRIKYANDPAYVALLESELPKNTL